MRIISARVSIVVLSMMGGLSGSFLPAQTPELPEITQAPPSVPYIWRNVVIRAGGFVTGLLFSPSQKGLVYARTDVGGAYRSTDAGEHWVALTDQFGRDESSYLGVESVAVDPSDASKLYLAAGMYSADWGGPAAVFRSQDQGATFQKTAMPFKMGGNDDGRGSGERLAVDPNLGAVLFFGSRKAGLWKSSDAGVSWAKVDSFPVKAKVTGSGENTGVTFVGFDASTGRKGSATKVIYVGVAQAGAGLYRSRDAGASWELVPGQPTSLFPNHGAVEAGRALYMSYNDAVGPNGIQNGSIQRFDLRTGKWKELSPLRPGHDGQGKFGYGGIAIDAQHPDTLMVSTIDRWWPGDTIFRSTDGGAHWKDVFATAAFSAMAAPWVYRHHDTITKTHWMNDIKIDPFDAGKVMVTSGEGIWGSADVNVLDRDKQTHWGFPNEGLEEFVANGVISPPRGAPLLSVVSDLDGFRHEDIYRSPAGGSFTNPTLSSGTGIDFAQSNPDIVVRVGEGNGKVVRGSYSLDNGRSWKPFAAEPPGSSKGAGTVAISADGKTVVWSPNGALPHSSRDWGRTWNRCSGLTEKMRVVSDRVNPAKFYSFDRDSGQLLESLDGGLTFAVRTQPVAPAHGRNAEIVTNPAREGDLWIAAADKVFHSSDSGITFVELRGMGQVRAMGFGKPAQGNALPVLFMNGTAASVEGTFRSEDNGLSWVRIDDAAHQFGWKNAVAGDGQHFERVYLATGGRGIVYGEPLKSR